MYVRGIVEAGSLPVLKRTLSSHEARRQNVADAATKAGRRRDRPVNVSAMEPIESMAASRLRILD